MKARKTIIFSVIAVSFIFLAYTVRVEEVDPVNQILETTDAEALSQNITGLTLETEGGASTTDNGETLAFEMVDTSSLETSLLGGFSSIVIGSGNFTVCTTKGAFRFSLDAEAFMLSYNLTGLTIELSFENGSLLLHQSSYNKSLAIDLEIVGEAYVFMIDDGETLVFEVDASGCGLLEAELDMRSYSVETSVDGQTESWSDSRHMEIFYEFLRSLMFDCELDD